MMSVAAVSCVGQDPTLFQFDTGSFLVLVHVMAPKLVLTLTNILCVLQ